MQNNLRQYIIVEDTNAVAYYWLHQVDDWYTLFIYANNIAPKEKHTSKINILGKWQNSEKIMSYLLYNFHFYIDDLFFLKI